MVFSLNEENGDQLTLCVQQSVFCAFGNGTVVLTNCSCTSSFPTMTADSYCNVLLEPNVRNSAVLPNGHVVFGYRFMRRHVTAWLQTGNMELQLLTWLKIQTIWKTPKFPWEFDSQRIWHCKYYPLSSKLQWKDTKWMVSFYSLEVGRTRTWSR